ncbi:concanavalin A-like lectin/glucanase domain-containing protein [Lentinula edodes]|uniref:Concanavalin A-like lectin/glucanase domain-containing protein n=1 Tax=Lentinula lateritia TaxID=40482 RepID=A0A9W9AJZ2_9AGAR|nr:concanavalin A-like lectin/glucanase domain-containing protein [Lentinula edodes]
MYYDQLFFAAFFIHTTLASPNFGRSFRPSTNSIRSRIRSILPSLNLSWFPPSPTLQSRSYSPSALDVNPNGTTFLWLPEDEYSGSTFFDNFSFYTGADPTHGTVNFLNATAAFSEGLAYVQDNGVVIMKGDNTTTLDEGVNRNSVRISSNKQYNTGLFILDTNQAPWGCGVWPAFWTVGGGTWPLTGEIDIIEGVHDNEHNQVTWHTGPNCTLTPEGNFTGTIVQTNGVNNTNCDGDANDNAGCGVTEWSRASYGPFFDQQGGGVFAMKWDENGIAVWSFYRAAIPQDIQAGSPNPSGWGNPVAALEPGGCDPISNFVNHSIIFDITFCGDWAGNSYATSGCPGTCSEQLMEPSNFDNATWSINSIKVYRKQLLSGQITGEAVTIRSNLRWDAVVAFAALFMISAII